MRIAVPHTHLSLTEREDIVVLTFVLPIVMPGPADRQRVQGFGVRTDSSYNLRVREVSRTLACMLEYTPLALSG